MLLRQTESKVGKSSWQRTIQRQGLQFASWCVRLNHRPWPATYLPVASFICNQVSRLQGSTKSISNVLSALRCFAKQHQHNWLSDSDSYRLQQVIKQLKYDDVQDSNLRRPATLLVLEQLYDSMDLKQLENQLFFLTCTMAHDGLFRGNELFSGIKVRDLSWCHVTKTFRVRIKRSKTHRIGSTFEVILPYYSSKSACKLLQNWIEKFDMWSYPEASLFPVIDSSSVDFSRSYSVQRWRNDIKRHFGNAGLSGYSGHSFRAGGATDLFAEGVPMQLVQRYGRWKSDAVLVYYKQEAIDIAHSVRLAYRRNRRSARKEFARKSVGSRGR